MTCRGNARRNDRPANRTSADASDNGQCCERGKSVELAEPDGRPEPVERTEPVGLTEPAERTTGIRRTKPLRRHRPDRRHELAWRRRGFRVIAGIDEVGRGCLAGPVVAAAVVLPKRAPGGIDDSKRLPALRREQLYEALRACGAHIGIGEAGPDEIDAVNIREASFLAMRRAVDALTSISVQPDALLVDGFELPDCAVAQQALVGGDGCCSSIAAASIIAKVVRDRQLIELAREYPGYGFDRHKGYPTPDHLRQLALLGPTEIHRKTFAPVAAILATARGC